jgi:hypothetical protein
MEAAQRDSRDRGDADPERHPSPPGDGDRRRSARPDLDLKRADGKLQGTTYIEYPVDLQMKGNTIIGRVSGDTWDLRLEPDGSEMRVTGLIAGNPRPSG